MRPLALFLAALLTFPAMSQQPVADPVFRSSVKLVVINVSVTNRDGKPIENLTKDDFELYENGKRQVLQTVELQRLETKPLDAMPTDFASRTPARPAAIARPKPMETKEALMKYQDRRLMILFFDFSSMQPAEQVRALKAAEQFIRTQLTASDMVSVMAFSSSLRTYLDFTADRDLLLSTIRGFHIGEGSELSGMADTGPDAEDQSGQFVADETEFNIFNTDRKLAALEDAAKMLASYPEKKALVYFSSGVEKTGMDNQSQLRATVNTAVRSNVAFYPIDARGLTASAPGGDASQAASAGSGLFSGRTQRSKSDSFQNQQETLSTLAEDTGGKALLDSNDLSVGIRQVQDDVRSYYVLAYSSTNAAEDGRYRRVEVRLASRVAVLKAKLDYRKGYYAPTSFTKMTSVDKESLLQQALESGNPATELPIAVESDWFRIAKGKYFVPVSVKIPGSALSFTSKGAKAATELDIAAEVRDANGRPASAVRDTIPLKVSQDTANVVVQKQIVYDTGFTLGPGKYSLRLVARENGEGKAGTFEAVMVVPDLNSGSALRMSSVVLSNQREPVKAQLATAEKNRKLLEQNPLITAGEKLVPNVTRVFRPGQKMLVYFEVYDPGAPETQVGNVRLASVAASIGFYQGDRKIFETAPVRANRMGTRGENVLPVWVQTTLEKLQPGQYTCQVNVVDELGRKFAFPRIPMAVVAAEPAPASTAPAL